VRALRMLGIVAFGAALVWSDTARADGPAYVVRPEVDVPVVVAAGAVSAGWMLRGELPPAYCSPLCDSRRVNAIDRAAAGGYRPQWSTVSDIGVVLTAGGALGTLIFAEGPKAGLNDATIVGETVLLGLATSVVSNTGTGRPRPYMYSTLAPLELRIRGDGALSFFSGHTTTAAALSVSLYSTLRRVPSLRPYAGWALVGGATLVSLVGIGRIAGGNHFPTDVLAGAAVGTAYGILVPALHKTQARLLPSFGTDGARINFITQF
jgi:membrane-associated phospholipid phosphatase